MKWTIAKAREQGRSDHRAGYPRTWTPHLTGWAWPPRDMWEAWEAGWDESERASRRKKDAAVQPRRLDGTYRNRIEGLVARED